jgi:hypothetical protein
MFTNAVGVPRQLQIAGWGSDAHALSFSAGSRNCVSRLREANK